jgi:hypothetical protein
MAVLASFLDGAYVVGSYSPGPSKRTLAFAGPREVLSCAYQFSEKSHNFHGNLQDWGLDNAKKLLYIESAFRKRFHNTQIGQIESLPQVPQYGRSPFLQFVKALKVFS